MINQSKIKGCRLNHTETRSGIGSLLQSFRANIAAKIAIKSGKLKKFFYVHSRGVTLAKINQSH
jgi:hypothetical protein